MLHVIDSEVLFTCFLIIIARIADVSMSTLRTVNVVHGRRGRAFLLGFFEVLIWVNVVSRVINKLSNPVYGVCYAFGFALGNYVGLSIEQYIAWGEQIARIFTRDPTMENELRERGFGVTAFQGRGKEGPVQELFVQVARRQMSDLLSVARKIDPNCYYLVGNVSAVSRQSSVK